MDTSIVAAIVGLLGAATVGGLGFILQGIRADIRAIGELIGGLGERLGGVEERLGGLGERVGGVEERLGGVEERVGGVEERVLSEFGEVKRVLARVEAAQAEHGRQFT